MLVLICSSVQVVFIQMLPFEMNCIVGTGSDQHSGLNSKMWLLKKKLDSVQFGFYLIRRYLQKLLALKSKLQ